MQEEAKVKIKLLSAAVVATGAVAVEERRAAVALAPVATGCISTGCWS
jgi:hypothetical protein